MVPALMNMYQLSNFQCDYWVIFLYHLQLILDEFMEIMINSFTLQLLHPHLIAKHYTAETAIL